MNRFLYKIIVHPRFIIYIGTLNPGYRNKRISEKVKRDLNSREFTPTYVYTRIYIYIYSPIPKKQPPQLDTYPSPHRAPCSLPRKAQENKGTPSRTRTREPACVLSIDSFSFLFSSESQKKFRFTLNFFFFFVLCLQQNASTFMYFRPLVRHLLSSLSQLVTLPFQSQVCLSKSKANPPGHVICFSPDLVHLRGRTCLHRICNDNGVLCFF